MCPRIVTLVLALVLAVALLAPPAAAQEVEEFSSDTMSHVANLPYEIAHPDARAASTHIPYGTDIEFATLRVGSGTPAVVERLSGANRIGTAVAVSAARFTRADTVVVATAEDYADALAGSPLAVHVGGPLLLSARTALSPETANEIRRLGATSALLLGGTAALSDRVERDLGALGVRTTRVGGANRFATAALVMGRLPATSEVFVAEGEHTDPARGWPDALSAAGLASGRRQPILLVNAGRLPVETAEALSSAVDATIVGGSAAVSEAVAQQIDERAGTLRRIAGANRYETSRRAAEAAIRRGADPAIVFTATGRNFPDGLVAGAATGAANGVLILVDGQNPDGSPASEAFIRANSERMQRLYIVGGRQAVSAAVEARLRASTAIAAAGTRDFAIGGSYYNGMQIIDITDPTDPSIAAVYDCGTLQGDIQVFTQGDRTYATFTSEDTNGLIVQSRCVQDSVAAGAIVLEDLNGDGQISGSAEKAPAYGTYIADITDPYDPTTAGFIPVREGSHNGTVHPSGNWFYNSNSRLIIDSGGTPGIEVYDIRDLAASRSPTRVTRMPLPPQPFGLGTDSHDVTFNAAGTRAYSAALSQTVIINTEDPANPSVISRFVDPAVNVEHQSDPMTVTASDGTTRDLLIVQDELAGAAGNGFCPGGGLHIYDVTGANEQSPQSHKVGVFFIPEFRPAGSGSGQGEAITCTSHVYRLYPEQGIMTIAWYNAGVWVVDISGLADEATAPAAQPMEAVGFFYFSDSDTWSFKTNRIERDGSFYGYGNDIARGLDVYRFQPAGAAAGASAASATGVEPGRWLTPEQALAEAQVSSPAPLSADNPLRCLLTDPASRR